MEYLVARYSKGLVFERVNYVYARRRRRGSSPTLDHCFGEIHEPPFELLKTSSREYLRVGIVGHAPAAEN